MRVEQLKRWQWALIGCFLGLVVAWAWGGVQDSGGISDPATIGAEAFERLLREPPMQGHPRVKGITLHHEKSRYWVTLKALGPDPMDPHPKNPRRYRYVREQLNATTPFMPDFRDAPSETVMIRVNPSAISKSHGVGRHEEEGSLPLWVNGAAARLPEIPARLQLKGWKIEPGVSADPGASAEMALALRPANYQLMIVLSSKQDKPPTSNDLIVKLNGHPVALSGPAPVTSGLAFKGLLSRDGFVPGSIQSIEFSRGAEPVRIWEMRLIDPTYSVADYLSFVKQSRPELDFSSAWWETLWVRYVLCGATGGILFGLFAPLVVLLFTGAQSSNQDPAYDLDRFKGEPKQQQQTASEKSEEIDLSAMEAKLAEGLEPRASTSPQAPPPPPPAPVELRGDADRPAPIEADESPEEYKGEFYPVARHPSHKHAMDDRRDDRRDSDSSDRRNTESL